MVTKREEYCGTGISSIPGSAQKDLQTHAFVAGNSSKGRVPAECYGTNIEEVISYVWNLRICGEEKGKLG